MFDLKRPCKDCPFADPNTLFLSVERKEEIANSLQAGAHFMCHNTFEWTDDEDETPMYTPRSQFCAGAIILLEKEETPHQFLRIAERINQYHPDTLNHSLVPWETFDDWVEFDPLEHR